MNLAPLSVLILFAGVLALPADAQLVHLSLHARESTLFLSGDNQADYPWDTHGYLFAERPVTLDIYYDAAQTKLVPDPVVGWYRPSDAAHNYWHLHCDDDTLGEHFDFTRPLSDLFAYDQGLDCSWNHFTDDANEYLYLSISFLPPLAGHGSLPVPPLPGFDPDFGARLEVDGSLFDLPGLAQAQLLVQFDSMRAELVPVPEPSAYGAAAALALAGLILRRRRLAGSARASRPAAPRV